MTIIVPDDYHAKEALVKNRVDCVSKAIAQKADIRPLRIGILNIMPKAETYEFNLLHPLGRSILQINPIWIRLKNHSYKSSDHRHLNDIYVDFETAIKSEPLDGLIVTGAPVEEIPFEEVSYWKEIEKILDYARKNIISTLGICWGGLALANMLGIKKINYDKKLFGVYKIKNLKFNSDITSEMDDVFHCPQSRHSGISDEELELARDKGIVNLLAHSQDAGYVIFESTDKKFLIHLGHPEYDSHRLVEEYNRDRSLNRTDVDAPIDFDVEHPKNIWKSHRYEFFSQWIRNIHHSVNI